MLDRLLRWFLHARSDEAAELRGALLFGTRTRYCLLAEWSYKPLVARDWRLWAGYGSLLVVGVGATIALAVVTHVLLQIDSLPALTGVVAIVGGVVCLTLLYRGRVGVSVGAFIVTCLVFTTTAMTYTARRANQLQDGPLVAERIRAVMDTRSQHEPRVAALGYFAPSLVYYVGQPIQRFSQPEQVSQFFEQGGDAVVMLRADFEKHHDRLPGGLSILTETPRFMKKGESVVVLGRSTEVARGNNRDQYR